MREEQESPSKHRKKKIIEYNESRQRSCGEARNFLVFFLLL